MTRISSQIRAQLGYIGCPLLGDDLYGALWERSVAVADGRGREQCQVPDKSGAGDEGAVEPEDEGLRDDGRWCRRMQSDPLKPLGRQAATLEVLEAGMMGPAPVVFEAGAPWWR